MIVLYLLAGVVSGTAAVLTGLWCGVGAMGVLALYALGGTAGCLCVLGAVALIPPQAAPAARSRHGTAPASG